MKVKELQQQGEKGGREWYKFLRGDNVGKEQVKEIIVRGEKVSSKDKIAMAIKDFWEDIGGVNERTEMDDFNLRIGEFDLGELDRNIERVEVKKVVSELKNGKAAGYDGVPYEMYKFGGEKVVDMLVNMFRSVWEEMKVPEKWNECKVMLLHKGGYKCKKELKNYRPIALMDTIGKIFCMILNNRLKECVDRRGILSEEQNGFRMNRRGEDNLFIVREIIEWCNRESKKGYVAFLDIEKAYDRVNRGILCKVLRKVGFSERIVSIIESMYVNTKAKYTLNEVESDWVKSVRDVRQGCILSPLLFGLYTEELTIRVKEAGLGMNVGNDKLAILLYADDVVLFSETSEELQEMLNVVSEYGKDFQVRFSEDKSKVMIMNEEETDKDKVWELGGNVIRSTREYMYLGVKVSIEGCDKAKHEKLFKANQWLGRLSSIAKYRGSKYDVCRELWKGMAVPSIMYGASGLTWNDCEIQKLEAVQNKIGRVALGANGYAGVAAIRGDMGWSSFYERHMKACVLFKVRIDKMEYDRWVKRVHLITKGKSKWMKACRRL